MLFSLWNISSFIQVKVRKKKYPPVGEKINKPEHSAAVEKNSIDVCVLKGSPRHSQWNKHKASYIIWYHLCVYACVYI